MSEAKKLYDVRCDDFAIKKRKTIAKTGKRVAAKTGGVVKKIIRISNFISHRIFDNLYDWMYQSNDLLYLPFYF